MAITPTIRNSLDGVYIVSNTVTLDLQATLAGVFSIVNFPTPSISASDVGAVVTTNYLAQNVQVAMVGVLVVGRGRIDNPKVRAWTFTLDGHDFYVLRLGDGSTLVYDVYSEQWVDWSSPDYDFWRPNTGMNWLGGQLFAGGFGSDVVVGDDVHGLLYFLDPKQPFDQTPLDYVEVQERYFERITMGQVPIRGREVMPCFAAWLTTDMGAPAYLGAGVTLYTSDDGGETFDDHGLVTVTPGEFNPELSWYSLGQIGAPGRLFKIVDDGAIVRIDGMEMNDPEDDG